MEGSIYKYVHLQVETTPVKHTGQVKCTQPPVPHPFHKACQSKAATFASLFKTPSFSSDILTLTSSHAAEGLNFISRWQTEDLRRGYKVTGHITRVRASCLLHQHHCMLPKMLTGTSSSPPTLGSKEKPAKQNHCHDSYSLFALADLIYNVSVTESMWFHLPVE